MRSLDLLATAEVLLSSARSKPTTASLCRALSSIYYAIFHCLAEECANLLIGSVKSTRSDAAWRQVYRSLEHGLAKSQCKNVRVMGRFSEPIVDFANAFVRLQDLRHSADYDPQFKITKSEVKAEIAASREVIYSFRLCNTKERRAFCAYVLLKNRS